MAILHSYTPVRVGDDEFESTVGYYESVFGAPCPLRFRYDAGGLEIATVGTLVVIGGSQEHLAAAVRQDLVAMVDSIDEWRAALPAAAEVQQEPADIPTGRNMYVRNPDGSLFEFVELNPAKVAAVNLAAGHV
ncbi:catechol 2,3-dioxygenase-like lactoylglutathione lyase family enzyme [Nocardia sp. GAS34]|uniref:VOC family protein n=1 Tax=unclassified Nocardia TaxID=2637762 RepID=UPI003D193198